MKSGTASILGFILIVGMTAVLELSKCSFLFESLSNTDIAKLIRIPMAIIAVILIGLSIFASSSYILNETNARKNLDIKNSDEYRQMNEGREMKKDVYSVQKKEIEDLKKLQEQTRLDGERMVNAMPSNYRDKRNIQREDTQNRISDIQASINAKSSELSSIANSLENPLDKSNITQKYESGCSAMFIVIANRINGEDTTDPVNPEDLELWFFLFVGIIFELVAVASSYLYLLKTGKGIDIRRPATNITAIKPKLATNSRFKEVSSEELGKALKIGKVPPITSSFKNKIVSNLKLREASEKEPEKILNKGTQKANSTDIGAYSGRV
jgi:hypothetical protein